MQNKYFVFGKNALLAAATGLLAGAGMAELSHYITDNKTITSIASTIASYIGVSGVFLPLHARDNKDVYRDEKGRFKWREFIWDQAKMTGGFIVLDIAYVIGKPLVVNEFLKNGTSPGNSSLYTDFVSAGIFYLASFPIARLTGNIRKKETLEEKVKEPELSEKI